MNSTVKCSLGTPTLKIKRDKVEMHVNIKMDMYENWLLDRLHAPITDIITVPAIIEITENNIPMVASGTDETVLSE